MGKLRRSEFLRGVPVALWGMACGEHNPARSGVPSGGSSSAGPEAGSGGHAGSTGGATGEAGQTAAPSTAGGTPTTGGAASTGGKNPTGDGGRPASGGKAAAAGGAPPTLTCGANIGARANAEDFSMNTETNQPDAHLLVMSKGDIIRRIFNYTTSGDADHQHEFEFTDAQLTALLAGEAVVVETEGPPLNAASGHTHTVRVHACTA